MDSLKMYFLLNMGYSMLFHCYLRCNKGSLTCCFFWVPKICRKFHQAFNGFVKQAGSPKRWMRSSVFSLKEVRSTGKKRWRKERFSGWWFQIFCIFTPKIGEDSHFDYFSTGLTPPTRDRFFALGEIWITIFNLGWAVAKSEEKQHIQFVSVCCGQIRFTHITLIAANCHFATTNNTI